MLGLAIQALFITNLWILIYTNIVDYLNIRFPSSLKETFFRASVAHPEPFEIPIYLILTVFMLLGVWLLYKHLINMVKQKKDLEKSNRLYILLKYAVLIFLIMLFIINLGSYPMARSIFPYKTPEKPLIYHLFVFIFLLSSIVIIVEVKLLSRVIRLKRTYFFFFILFVFILTGLVTFEPQFPILGHDYSYFLGPVWEITHGKTIYTEVPSQYGFLSILFLALLSKFNIVHPFYLPALIWILYTLEYTGIFILIYKISDSLNLAMLGLLSIFTLNYFSIYHVPSSIPQTGPFRFFPLVASVFLLYFSKNINSKKFIIAIAAMSFWVLDTGISLILAYLFTLFLLFLMRAIDFKKILISFLWLGASLFVIFIIINAIGIFLGYKLIDIVLVFSKLSQYAKAGFGMLPIDGQSYFWLVMLIYFATIIYFFKKQTQNLSTINNQQLTILLFSANLSLFASVYFVGRSHPHNLFHISIFPILNAFLLIGLIFKNFQASHFKLLTSSLLFLIFIAFPIYNRQEIATKTIKDKMARFRQGSIFTPISFKLLYDKYRREIELVKKELPEKHIVILSPDDTYLFYLTNKENMLYDNSQFTILTKNDMDFSLQKVYKACPKKIAADCSLFQKCQTSKPFTLLVGLGIQPILLNQIETACKIKYQPFTCTDQLCIVRSQKS